ncbi:MAG: YceH family protein [Bacteroidota bacterium]
MSLPTLDPIELRVVGAMIEKSLATPDSYPLTLNSLRSACNQSSSRDPVMDLSERDVSQALDRLRRRRLVGTASGAGHRVAKFRHALAEAMDLSRRELAVLAVLVLRGPQTAGEIRSRVGRMCDLANVAEAEEVLWMLGERESPLVAQLPREPGRSADRFAHTLAGDVAPTSQASEDAAPDEEPPPLTLAERVAGLEQQVAGLRAELTGLRERLGDSG